MYLNEFLLKPLNKTFKPRLYLKVFQMRLEFPTIKMVPGMVERRSPTPPDCSFCTPHCSFYTVGLSHITELWFGRRSRLMRQLLPVTSSFHELQSDINSRQVNKIGTIYRNLRAKLDHVLRWIMSYVNSVGTGYSRFCVHV